VGDDLDGVADGDDAANAEETALAALFSSSVAVSGEKAERCDAAAGETAQSTPQHDQSAVTAVATSFCASLISKALAAMVERAVRKVGVLLDEARRTFLTYSVPMHAHVCRAWARLTGLWVRGQSGANHRSASSGPQNPS
jgi:hypothetical protein